MNTCTGVCLRTETSSERNGFKKGNHLVDRRRRTMLLSRLFILFFAIAAMKLNLQSCGCIVVARSIGSYSLMKIPASNDIDQLWRKRSYASLKQRWIDAFLISRGAVERRKSQYLGSISRIQRGGANRFVKEDNENKLKKTSGETAGIDAHAGNGNLNRFDNMSESNGHQKHSPVVYQYFGRSRNRGGHSHQLQADDSPLNFILLGPNVDHWKTVGQRLASRGFNVMACERMVGKQNDDAGSSGIEDYEAATNYEDAPDLVLEILDALKWDKAVIVGCDDESALAMETAIMLGPNRVAGLILCGDLSAANQCAEDMGGVRVLDSFLHRVLDCPFVIVWDGGARSIASGSSTHEAIETKSSPFDDDGLDVRCVILGGGSAPHRTKPEYFAWILARFVEEKLEYHSMEYTNRKQRSNISESSTMKEKDHIGAGQNKNGIFQRLNLPFGIDSLVSPEGRLLLGRAVAAAIFYTSIMKVIFVQYGILRKGCISIKNSVDSVDALRRKIFQPIGAFVWNLGYIPRLFKISLKRTKDLDEDGIDRSKSDMVPTDEPDDDEENDGKTSVSPKTRFEEDNIDTPQEDDEDDDNDQTFRIKPLFFLDDIFT